MPSRVRGGAHTALTGTGGESPWAAYLAALPERVLTPVCLDDAQLTADVQYEPMVDKIRDMQRRLQHDFDNCSPLDLVSTDGSLSPLPPWLHRASSLVITSVAAVCRREGDGAHWGVRVSLRGGLREQLSPAR